jgi:hypothetical protein
LKSQQQVIGRQYYHSGRDLLEWGRDLESFNHFGKAIHITEMGFPSPLAPYPGQKQCVLWGGAIGGEAMLWHGDFTETIQADYVESVTSSLTASLMWSDHRLGLSRHWP